MRKGQGAMEYLMTYGWALLVIIIVGAALFALGVLNPATYQQKRCNGLQYFTYMDQNLVANGNYTLHVRNGVNKITVNSIDVGSVSITTPNVNDNDIRQGDEFTISGNVSTGGYVATTNYDDISVVVTYDVDNGISGNTDSATCVVTAS